MTGDKRQKMRKFIANRRRDLSRLRRIIQAQELGAAKLQGEKEQIATEVVPAEILAIDPLCRATRNPIYRDQSDFDATQEAARALGRQLDKLRDLDISSCPEKVFVQLWRMRQIIDETGLDYGRYIDIAIRLVRDRSATARITPITLVKGGIAEEVMWEHHHLLSAS